jgi:general secretion pathway protein K
VPEISYPSRNNSPKWSASDPHSPISEGPGEISTSSRSLAWDTRDERGFVLLIVLLTLVLLASFVIGITGNGRTEIQLANDLRTNAMLEADTDGAIYDAIFHEITSPGSAAATRYTTPAGVDVRVEDEAGKVNPNTASTDLLQALLRRVGADTQTSYSLAAAIADWRDDNARPRPMGAKAPEYRAAGRKYGPPEEPIESLGELSNVLGMTPQILARMAPYLSIYNDGEPVLHLADPVVARAIHDVVGDHYVSPDRASATGRRTLTITATAHGPAGAVFRRRAVIRIEADAATIDYRILSWEGRSPNPAGD